MDITLAELRNMTDDEVRDLNRTLAKKVMKKFIIQAVTTTAVTLAAIAIANRLMNEPTDSEES